MRELLKFGQEIQQYVPNSVVEELEHEEKN